ncbi:hypothetical protein ACLKMH_05510 [Psychromonas sp. KJ10-10]|uniref:hypothetical protein n=1 Tax=Psychromonas sp. KJ10-10 TaxID=3391823 RepID=UPI0039B3E229
MSNGANIPSLHFRKDITASGIMGKEVNNYTTTFTSAVLGKSIYESSKTIAENNQ